MLKKTTVIAAILALAISSAAMPAQAGKKTARALAIGAISAIGAITLYGALTSKNARAAARDPRLSFRDRAIATCLNAAYRQNVRRGGEGVEFLRLRKAVRKSYGLKLYIYLRSYGPWGAKRRQIKCKVTRSLRLRGLVWL